jgi:hypothetical protein
VLQRAREEDLKKEGLRKVEEAQTMQEGLRGEQKKERQDLKGQYK